MRKHLLLCLVRPTGAGENLRKPQGTKKQREANRRLNAVALQRQRLTESSRARGAQEMRKHLLLCLVRPIGAGEI